ncbi:hypothetical protein LCGC14_2298600 [marine sediment metagenome]|uniref:Uncharacterized protein n=1 Tax=marine sediment metagenome TaxID=412755 RepID=A0A0F9DBP1_9ZZZZ
MTVVEAVSTNGVYKTYSSTNATLATALSDVLNELDSQKKSFNNTKFVSVFDDTGQEFTFIAIVKGG